MPALIISLLGHLLKSLVNKLLIAFGIAFISYKGYEFVLDEFKQYIQGSLNSMPVDIANILLIAGFGQGLGYLFGALAFSITMQTANKIVSFGNEVTTK